MEDLLDIPTAEDVRKRVENNILSEEKKILKIIGKAINELSKGTDLSCVIAKEKCYCVHSSSKSCLCEEYPIQVEKIARKYLEPKGYMVKRNDTKDWCTRGEDDRNLTEYNNHTYRVVISVPKNEKKVLTNDF